VLATCGLLGGCDLILLNENFTTPPPPPIDAAIDAPPLPPFCFGDDFAGDAIDTTRWAELMPGSPVAVSQSAGVFRVAFGGGPCATCDYTNGIYSTPFNFTGATLDVNVVPGELVSLNAETTVLIDAAGPAGSYSVSARANMLYFRGTNQPETMAPYNDAFGTWRIRHDLAGPDFVFEMLLDGSVKELARMPTAVSTSFVRVHLFATNINNGAGGGESTFDDLKVYGMDCVTQ
jgi:hypothetical protein